MIQRGQDKGDVGISDLSEESCGLSTHHRKAHPAHQTQMIQWFRHVYPGLQPQSCSLTILNTGRIM